MSAIANDEVIAVARPIKKRKRAAFACEACRLRKRRCDGEVPACQGCRRRRSTCVYSSEVEALERHNSMIESLRARLSQLEQAQAVEQQIQTGSLVSNYQTPQITSRGRKRAADNADLEDVLDRPGSHVISEGAAHSVTCGPDVSNRPYDTGRLQNELRGLQPFKLERLMRPIEQALEQRASTSPPSQLGSLEDKLEWSSALKMARTGVSPSPCTCHAALDAGHWNLPMRKRADSLLARYFARTHQVFPVLHQPTFQMQYERLWTASAADTTAQQKLPCVKLCQQKCHGRLFPPTLNMIFALSSLHDMGTPSQNAEQADYFFRLTKGVDLMDVLQAQMQIEPIQLGILISIYLQTTERFIECWNMAGLTIRTAQSIGLDLGREEALEHGLADSCTTQVDWELKKRLWGACMILKGEISSSFGRRILINSSTKVQLPESIDDDQLSEVVDHWSSQPVDVPSWMDGFVQKVKLMQLLEYNSDSNDNMSRLSPGNVPDYQPILNQDTKLMQWNAALPPHLKRSSVVEDVSQDQTAATHNQDDSRLLSVKRLRSWYLHVRQLNLRPALEYLFAKKNRQTLQPAMVTLESTVQELSLSKIALQCVVLAQRLIELLEAERNVLIAWWINIDYLYTCGSTILMARCCSLKDDNISEGSLASAWQCCLERLSQYTTVSSVARKSHLLLRSSARQLFGAEEGQPSMQKDPDHTIKTLEPTTQAENQRNLVINTASDIQAGRSESECITRDNAVSGIDSASMAVTMDFTTFDTFDSTFWDSELALNIPCWPSLSELDQLPANL